MSDVPETALPPLPEAAIEDHDYELWGQNARGDFYSAEQMKAYARAAIEAAVREQPKPQPQERDSAVASEGGSCVSAPPAEAVAWRHKMRINGEFDSDWILTKTEPPDGVLVIAKEALVPLSVLSTAGAQRRASEQDETTSAKEPQMAMTQAAFDVLAERQRQIEKEGWTPKHDDEHANGELARAAGAYALYAAAAMSSHPGVATSLHRSAAAAWPWDEASKANTSTERRMLVKAGALVLAEIERLDRAKEQR